MASLGGLPHHSPRGPRPLYLAYVRSHTGNTSICSSTADSASTGGSGEDPSREAAKASAPDESSAFSCRQECSRVSKGIRSIRGCCWHSVCDLPGEAGQFRGSLRGSYTPEGQTLHPTGAAPPQGSGEREPPRTKRRSGWRQPPKREERRSGERQPPHLGRKVRPMPPRHLKPRQWPPSREGSHTRCRLQGELELLAALVSSLPGEIVVEPPVDGRARRRPTETKH